MKSEGQSGSVLKCPLSDLGVKDPTSTVPRSLPTSLPFYQRSLHSRPPQPVRWPAWSDLAAPSSVPPPPAVETVVVPAVAACLSGCVQWCDVRQHPSSQSVWFFFSLLKAGNLCLWSMWRDTFCHLSITTFCFSESHPVFVVAVIFMQLMDSAAALFLPVFSHVWWMVDALHPSSHRESAAL